MLGRGVRPLVCLVSGFPAQLAHVRNLSEPSSSSITKRLPTEDDNCPICYETMYGVADNALNFCETCGNALHDECWRQCTKLPRLGTHVADVLLPSVLGQASSSRNGKSVTCVWCRAETVPTGGRQAQTGGYTNEGYLNLGAIAGCSPTRDTSTCELVAVYHFPRFNGNIKTTVQPGSGAIVIGNTATKTNHSIAITCKIEMRFYHFHPSHL